MFVRVVGWFVGRSVGWVDGWVVGRSVSIYRAICSASEKSSQFEKLFFWEEEGQKT